MRLRVQRGPEREATEDNEDDGGQNVDRLCWQAVGEFVSQVDDGRKNVNTNRTIKIILLIMTV